MLVQFIVKKGIFYFVHKYLRRWLVTDSVPLFRIMSKEDAGFLFNFSGARKPKGAYPMLSQALNRDPSQG